VAAPQVPDNSTAVAAGADAASGNATAEAPLADVSGTASNSSGSSRDLPAAAAAAPKETINMNLDFPGAYSHIGHVGSTAQQPLLCFHPHSFCR
jgi:hypothetical protein